MQQSFKEWWAAIRNTSTPLVVIESHDELATITAIKGITFEQQIPSPMWQWDCAVGYSAMSQAAEVSEPKLEGIEQIEDALIQVRESERIPPSSILCYQWRSEFWSSPTCRQALINLRNTFKVKRKTAVVIVTYGQIIPEDVRVHCITYRELLPDQETLGEIADQAHKTAQRNDTTIEDMEEEKREQVIAILKGMNAFQAEQQSYLSLRKGVGVDTERLQASKIDLINQTPGLMCWQGGESFSDVVGLTGIQSYLEELCTGKVPVRLVIWIDEIEKALAGAEGDTSGVSQDFMGALLSHLVDSEAMALLLFGQPGTGKSLVAKATGNLAQCLTIRLDLGAVKSSLVGESEARLRKVLAIEQAISEVGHTLWLCTCNGVRNLPSELRSRFLKEFFYDFPTPESQRAMWQFYIDKYQLSDAMPVIQGQWTGREIQRACREAWQLSKPLSKTMESIIPVAVSGFEAALNRQKEAHLRYLDAQRIGVYRMPGQSDEGRAVNLN